MAADPRPTFQTPADIGAIVAEAGERPLARPTSRPRGHLAAEFRSSASMSIPMAAITLNSADPPGGAFGSGSPPSQVVNWPRTRTKSNRIRDSERLRQDQAERQRHPSIVRPRMPIEAPCHSRCDRIRSTSESSPTALSRHHRRPPPRSAPHPSPRTARNANRRPPRTRPHDPRPRSGTSPAASPGARAGSRTPPGGTQRRSASTTGLRSGSAWGPPFLLSP